MTDTEKRIQIVAPPSEKNPFIVFYKPSGIPSAPLYEGDESAFTQLAEIFPEILKIRGKKQIEGGLLHRIDTETEGLLLCAATQKSYDSLADSQKNGLFKKKYSAQCDFVENFRQKVQGFPHPVFTEESENCIKKYTVKSNFRSFSEKGKSVRPVTKDSGKAALKKASEKTYTTKIVMNGDLLADCSIAEGYRHQVRCHLAWIGFPIKGDALYNPLFDGEKFCFRAYSISFPHPLNGEIVEFEV
jgi:23S rRNA pseudouridine1911/1915/1917 synthase